MRAPSVAVTAKARRHPFEEGDTCLFNYPKRMDFAPLPDMARLRGNDAQVHLRLFTVASSFKRTVLGQSKMQLFQINQ
jgi:hypothetical protein